MDGSVRAEVAAFLHRLDHLTREGDRLLDAVTPDPSGSREHVSLWQRECAATISQLSGGSKAHWLSRAYSDAFLLSAGSGPLATEATVAEIVGRILTVLARTKDSLSQAAPDAIATASRELPSQGGRFDFVRDLTLRSSLEQAYKQSQAASELGDFGLALVTSCSVLEAIITDVLERSDPGKLFDCGVLGGDVASWPFENRIAVAEKAGLISAGCARLPMSARRYHDLLDETGAHRFDAAVSERDATRAAQVHKVIIRDLAPGR